MLEDQVAYLLQRYLGNYVRGLNKEALKISVWRGDVELTNMQLKPEALNALNLPVKVKAGFLGSVKLKVPWSRLGQDPVLVSLDRIFLLAEPATQVEGRTEDAVQEAKKSRVREMELKLLEKAQQLKTELNQSWLGSLVSTIIGNLKLSISNIHIRYEDLESNPGHPFAAGLTLERLSAVTIDDNGRETFITGGALDRIQKFVELDRLALYLDSDVTPWYVNKPWEDLPPSEWVQTFRFGTKNGRPAEFTLKTHTYILQPVTGNANYTKLRPNEFADSSQPLHKSSVNLDDVTLCLSKNGYRDVLKLADNFAAFNQRLKYAHFRPNLSVKSDPRSWWKYAYKAVSDQMKKASGKMSWDQVLKFTSLRKKYISLYASLLKADPSRLVVDDNPEIEDLDHGLDIELILQWRMLAHKFVRQSTELDPDLRKPKTKKSWWSFGRGNQALKDEGELFLREEDWEQLNKIIGYREGGDSQPIINMEKVDALHTFLEVHMKHNASKLIGEAQNTLAELSCDSFDCSIKLYPEAKVFNLKLGSYQLSSPNGLLAVSATANDSLTGVFSYKPFDVKVDWCMVAKASPCYVTYLKDSVDQIVSFFESNTTVSHAIALETAAAVQMTINEVKRTAQQQVNRALKDHTRFLLDLDIAAPKITIPTGFRPDNANSTKLLIDLGNLVIRTEDASKHGSLQELDMYLQFDLVLSDVSAFLVDGDYHWGHDHLKESAGFVDCTSVSYLPVVDKCGVILKLQLIRLENPSFPSTRIAVRLPSLGFHFSPARYHRLMEVVKIFQVERRKNSGFLRPWDQADFEGLLSLLSRKGVGNREAVWTQRYICLVGPYIYVLESPGSTSYKQYLSLSGKQVLEVPAEDVGDAEHVLAVCDPARSNGKVVEDSSAFILCCDSEDSRKTWKSRLQGAIYRASGSAPITGLSETSSDTESESEVTGNREPINLSAEDLFVTGVLDELKVCFSSTSQHGQSFMKVLLAEEYRLFEFRAIGGRVELSIRSKDMFIGTILKSLEIEDLICRKGTSQSCYLARSFIRNTNECPFSDDVGSQSFENNGIISSEGDDKFYEAPETLLDSMDSQMQSPLKYESVQNSFTSESSLSKPPSFSRIAGLLPCNAHVTNSKEIELTETLDSFVKAQIVMYDQNSARYNNIDKKVTVTLATLSFFCRRPTVIAIMEFANAITVEDERFAYSDDNSSSGIKDQDTSKEEVSNGQHSVTREEATIKGLLGKGKSRVIFSLALNMSRAQIFLMYENETKLASFSQDNLLTDIKVFPSSFSIKASLGNLRISDEGLPSNHMYFWACDMRNPGGSSFIELYFSSFSVEDDDYDGYEYSLFGKLSEVRIVYLNRFIQEVINYFMGLVPKNSRGTVKVKDQVTNSEKWFTTGEIEGSPALKLDLSLRKPIIIMPRRTESKDYLKLDVVHITIRNTFQWVGGSKTDMNAVHLDIMTVMVEDINLNVGTGTELGESIIQDVKGISVSIRRSLRDLLHQIPSIEVAVQIQKLKAALSNREYQIITECAVSNISETPHTVPPFNSQAEPSSSDVVESVASQNPDGFKAESSNREAWITMKVSVAINLVELCLHAGIARDASLATVQASGAWLLYKSNTVGDGFLSATLKGFSVIDDREGTEQEFRLAIGKPQNIGSTPVHSQSYAENTYMTDASITKRNETIQAVPTMLILDARISQFSTFVSLSLQRPQLLVALDFLLAVVEFFVPTVGNILSSEEDKIALQEVDAIIVDQSTYVQPSSEISLSPKRPLVADDQRFDHFIYDGNGGILYLKDRDGFDLSGPSLEAIIYIGSGKKLQFKNVVIKNGQYLDSCIFMGTNSSYSASEEDQVHFDGVDGSPHQNSLRERIDSVSSQSLAAERLTEYIVEFQAIGPELTFYNTSRNVGESPSLSNKLLHAQLDAIVRLVMKGDTTEISADTHGLTMESNGIRILEPFDTSIKYSNSSGKTNIHFSVSDIFMNLSFSILRLFLAVEEDILEFLRMTSTKMTVVCSEFDKVGTIRNHDNDQVYVFWRPSAPPGFAVLGDYLTPLDKPPTKGVLAVNTYLSRVKRPVSFRLIWPPMASGDISQRDVIYSNSQQNGDLDHEDGICSIWFPEAPMGYVALGCVVSNGIEPPPLSSSFCISTSLVSPCSLRDCIMISSTSASLANLAFWRVDNCAGTFLPASQTNFSLMGGAYELRHLIFRFLEAPRKAPKSTAVQASPSRRIHNVQAERSTVLTSGWHFEAVASFQLIWWNRGSKTRKQLSIWRPVVPLRMIYFGDIAVQGFEPPNSSVVLPLTGAEELFKAPMDFHLVGKIKKQRGMDTISFWLPQAPPGFVSLGCIASKGTPKQQDLSSLRCIRSDLVTGDQFMEESLWDTSDTRLTTEPFSVWVVGNELGTFIVRSGFKRPPRRFALKLANPSGPSGWDDVVIDADVRTFSVALFDDYAGLMVPLFNVSLSGIGFSLHGRTDYLNCVVNFSLTARSYNDKYESWEPLVEPVDGFVRYQYDLHSPGTVSQIRLTASRDLNINVSVSNANMIIQAYSSWNNLSHAHEYYKKKDTSSPTFGQRNIMDALHRKNFYIIPQNKLGQDIYIRATEVRGLPNVIWMPSGDMKPVKVPVSKNMLDSHLEGKLCRRPRTMVTVIIADAELPRVEGLASHKYIVTARLVPHQGRSTESQPHQQSARTSGSSSDKSLFPELQLVAWNEMFFFKVDSPDFYTMELIVTDMGTGHPIGFFSAPLSQIAGDAEDRSHVHDFQNKLTWVELSSSANEGSTDKKSSGRIRCTALLSPRSESESSTQPFSGGRKSGFIQISPTREGPWTSVRLNYAAPAACWRLGNDVVASEASVKDGNRYVNIRSLVSVHNSTDFIIDLRLVSRDSKNSSQLLDETSNLEDSQFHGDFVQIDDFFEIEKYNPRIGWVGNLEGGQDISDGASTPQEISGVDLPVGWEWIDDWHLDNSTATSDGWVYAPDIRNLRWPESYNPLNSVDCSARQRRWIRNRKQISGNVKKEISVGILKPGETLPIPLPGLSQSEFYVLHLRPSNLTSCDQYSWSSVVDRSGQEGELGNPKAYSEICVSNLTESEELLYCTQISENSSSGSSKLWFSLSIEALEIAKDIHSDPIQDWNLVIKSPVSVTNFLPLAAEFSVLEKQASGHFVASFRGVFRPGETVKVYDSDIRNPLFFSLLPQRGWLPVQEAVLISHPRGVPSKTFSLRSCITGRVVQIILEQNQDKEQPFLAKIIRVYAPYWFAVARCPPLRFRIVEITGKKHIRKIGVPFKSKNSTETFEEIDEEEIFEGHTIVPALNFKLLGLSVSIAQPENVHFGPVKELSPLGDMDGSLDLYAYDAEGNCMQLFISTKPCPHQSVPTKVISVRPFMTFTNRLGRDLFIKLSSEDDQKILRASDSRVSFAYRQTDGLGKLQVRLEDTSWSFPVHVTKEDTIILVLRRDDGTRTFLRIEIRGFEEGSRFIVVFRIGSANGPMRIENRTVKTISIRQSGFGEDAWIRLQPLSTTNFCWEDPYGQPFLDAKIDGDSSFGVWKLDLESTGLWSTEDGVTGLNCHIEEEGNVKVAKFRDGSTLASRSDEEIRLLAPSGSLGNSQMQGTVQNNAAPIELIIELGVVGVSIIDHRPKELLYLYLERVFVSYSTGYGGGTSRLKLILGHLQIDNQLPLTLMPVLLAPEQVTYIHNPTFKMTITIRNENIDGIQVYPYIYMRVTEKWWRLNIHEPIIWALVNFYNSLQLGRLPQSSSVTQVDPEIRIDLIDVSEVRLKVSLETAPAQRPHGVLGVWSPILSAVGNAFKIQVHLRRVMHRDRFMRKSSIIPAIGNRIFRDLIHNPLHLIFSVDVLGMTSSTLASLSRGFAELSTDGEFLQLRSKQVWSRRITGVGDGIIQGTEAFAQGVAFGVTGMVTKPVESARQNGLLGLAHGLGQAFLGFFVQPVSGALDFFSLTVDGISASCSRCLQLFNNTVIFQRIRNPRAIHAYCIVREYCEREAIGQMILHLAEARTNLGCTEIFKEPSKFALSDYYEEHFIIPNQKVVLVTNRRVMLLQCPILDKIDKKPSKIMWDVPWEKLMALELAKAGYDQPSHLILHLKYFRRSENFVRIIRCSTDEQEGREPQSVRICSVVRKMWKAYQSDVKSLLLKVPSSQRHVYFAWSEDDGRESRAQNKAIINSRELLSVCSTSDETRFVTHVINFTKIWSSELESKGRCTLCKKQVSEDARICTIWRPICPNGYVSIGDIAHLGDHPPNVAAVYRKIDRLFAPPVGYDLVWRNCPEDYITPVSIWYPRAPEGFICLGCVAVDDYVEPDTSLVHCVAESLAEETDFEEQKVWSTPESYPWACHIYQVRSDALHFVAVRQSKEESDWKAMRVLDDPNCHSESSVAE